MLDVVFPLKDNQHYWDIHYNYFLQILKRNQCNITFQKRDDFIVTIEGKDFLIDYWDDSTKENPTSLPRFKFHCTKEDEKTFAFTPVSFYDWGMYQDLQTKIEYKAKGLITCRQRPYGGAVTRRRHVQKMLREHFGPAFVNAQIPQNDFFNEINHSLIQICVPGFCNNMLDRGQLQWLALGACTISPYLPEILPFSYRLEPNMHYICCTDNYSNLIELINWCKKNKNKCIEIGQNAKELFKKTSTPERLISWIKSKI